ncbi:tRNA glutamyl-Q(34) synthetase GluQRS [Arenicella xantha]|uniref:Glutamyl-Q tRNA(Asp) synthetase n=1 Tax=Arenicella xantha TaxID=644221 RepID=A0A395JLM9_9GAMM|nr:tRNA glutamyl-Q(34) synthetase GluQRS [Arenicella xantha]RBP48690.1 glutamyl-tRNA synthetase [Arenicella xantha]
MAENTIIVGRYAPSPTGTLHLGNLRTAILAWLHARLQHGVFYLRMEDLDTPRTVAGSAAAIVSDLQWLGLDWDSDIIYQSQRDTLYDSALATLKQQGLIYPCFCSRKDIQQAASAPHVTAGVYPGTCANLTRDEIQQRQKSKTPAYRVRVKASLQDSVGDFVVKRADGLFAYQLAVVVDDLAQGITHVVRGNDLADSAERQQYLASLLAPNRAPITYLHAPLMLDSDGNKLAKRDGSDSLDTIREQNITAAELIGQLMFELKLINSPTAISLDTLRSKVSIAALTAQLT